MVDPAIIQAIGVVVTVCGLIGGLIALAEKGLRLVQWSRDALWVRRVRKYLPTDPGASESGIPPDVTVRWTSSDGEHERQLVVGGRRERAAEWGRRQGYFFLSRDDEGRTVLRQRSDVASPRGEPVGASIRRAIDELADRDRKKES